MDDFHAARLCELMEQIELHLRCISNSIYRIQTEGLEVYTSGGVMRQTMEYYEEN
ncbi:MAG: hypothetical protein ACLTE2_12460 [Eubacteriales bacterium]